MIKKRFLVTICAVGSLFLMHAQEPEVGKKEQKEICWRALIRAAAGVGASAVSAYAGYQLLAKCTNIKGPLRESPFNQGYFRRHGKLIMRDGVGGLASSALALICGYYAVKNSDECLTTGRNA